jgi:hypothetical protein
MINLVSLGRCGRADGIMIEINRRLPAFRVEKFAIFADILRL